MWVSATGRGRFLWVSDAADTKGLTSSGSSQERTSRGVPKFSLQVGFWDQDGSHCNANLLKSEGTCFSKERPLLACDFRPFPGGGGGLRLLANWASYITRFLPSSEEHSLICRAPHGKDRPPVGGQGRPPGTVRLILHLLLALVIKTGSGQKYNLDFPLLPVCHLHVLRSGTHIPQ